MSWKPTEWKPIGWNDSALSEYPAWAYFTTAADPGPFFVIVKRIVVNLKGQHYIVKSNGYHYSLNYFYRVYRGRLLPIAGHGYPKPNPPKRKRKKNEH